MSSTFSRWRKVELLDLAEKLHILGLPNSIRKKDLIEIIEEHLSQLGEPLDIDVEYPELKSFYDSFIKSVEESDQETEPQVDDLDKNLLEEAIDAVIRPKSEEEEFDKDELDIRTETDEEAVGNELDDESSQEEIVSSIDEAGDDVTEEEEFDNEVPFRFDFQDYLADIKDSVVSMNESAQEFLSTTRTISTIFGAIELYFIAKPLIQLQNRELSLSALLTWMMLSYVIPSIVGYYINFCRYDFTIKVDPMIFYLTKALLTLTILQLNLNTIFSSLPEPFVHNSIINYIQLGLHSWKNSLGQLPLIFSVVGIILTLYII